MFIVVNVDMRDFYIQSISSKDCRRATGELLSQNEFESNFQTFSQIFPFSFNCFYCPILINTKMRETLVYKWTEMEFLDISLTTDSSLLLYAIHSPFYWQILKKNIVYSSFKNPKKSEKQENSSLFMNSIAQNKKIRIENQTKTQV